MTHAKTTVPTWISITLILSAPHGTILSTIFTGETVLRTGARSQIRATYPSILTTYLARRPKTSITPTHKTVSPTRSAFITTPTTVLGRPTQPSESTFAANLRRNTATSAC